MSVELLIANLLRVASEDLDGARTLARTKNRNAIYLCEQAAEKVIRAVVSSERLHAGVRHRLDEMVDLVPDANPLKPTLRAIEYLAAYATTYRYPTATGRIKAAPDEKDLDKAIRCVEKAIDAASIAFAVDLARRDTPARRSDPVR